MDHSPKVMIVTTPIRPAPTTHPPVGSLSIATWLRKAGKHVKFYDIDALRPKYEDVRDL